MELVARTRLTLDIPFTFEVGENDETGHNQDRVDAAKYAEKELIQKLEFAGLKVKVVDHMVEEVFEA